MQRAAAANIDRGISKAAPQEATSAPGQETAPATAEKPRMTDFKPYVGRKRKSGTGCVTETTTTCLRVSTHTSGPTAKSTPAMSTPTPARSAKRN